MSKEQVMKDIFSEKINPDKIYQNVLSKVNEEENMNKVRNKKIIYGIIYSVAMLVLCIGVVINYNKTINNKNELGKIDNSNLQKVSNEKEVAQNDNIIFNTDIASISEKLVDVEGEWKDTNIEEKFEFIKNIDILKQYEHLRQGMVYVKENAEDTKYSKLQQYELIYYMDGNNAPSTEIIFTKENGILQCMLPNENNLPSSIINGYEVKLFKTKNFFDNSKVNAQAYFEHNDYKFYIESQRIDENNFIDIIKSILKEF